MKMKVDKAVAKLMHDEWGISVHKKLYKAGKLWLVASLATAVFGISMLGMGLTAQANTALTQNGTTETVTQVQTNGDQNTDISETANATTLSTKQSTKQTNVQKNGENQTTIQTPQPAKEDQSASQKTSGEPSTPDQKTTDTSQPAQVTNLGNAKDDVVAVAKTKAEAQYEKTGQAQVITQTDPSEAPISGVNGTAAWTINDGVLTISSGNIDGSGTLWSTDINHPTPTSSAITSVKIAPNSKVTVSGNGAISLFSEMPNVQTIDLTGLDTSAATSMKSMFEDDENLTSITFGDKFDTSNVTSMKWMFANCGKLTDLKAAENFDTSNVTEMYGMFENTGINSLNLSHYDTSKVTTMAYMFRGDEKLTSVDVSSFDTSHVTDFSNMFSRDGVLATLDISNFNMKNVITEPGQHGQLPFAGEMFNITPGLWKLTVGPNVVLTNALLADAPGNNKPLPGSSTAVNYNNNWQIVGSGSDYVPAGTEERASTVMANYSLAKVNSGEATKQTYVWAQKVPEQKVTNIYTVVNALTGQPISPSESITTQGKSGDPITITNTINTITINGSSVTFPTNFYYATTTELKAGQTQPVTSVFGKTDQSHNIYVIEVAEPADPIAVKTKTAVPTPVSMPPIVKTAVPTPLYTTMNQTSVPTPPANTPETDTNVPTPPTSSTEIEHGMVPNEPTTDQHESTPPEQSGEQTSVESDTDNSSAQGSAVVTTGKLQSNHSQNAVKQNAQQLPQTNESSESLMTWIGLSLLAMFGSFVSVFSSKKRHDA